MRITGGFTKGRKLKAPKGFKITRPALAKVREAIFGALGSVKDLVVLDIFAGTGSLGFEALSREACFVYFVDSHDYAISCLIANAKELRFTESCKIFKRSLPMALVTLKIERPVDLVFCDPPYEKNLVNKSLAQLTKVPYLSAQAVIVVEHHPREIPNIKGLDVFWTRAYGQTNITMLKKSEETCLI